MKRDAHPLPPERMEAENAALPPHGADDGKTGGKSAGGKPATGNFGGQHAGGDNAQHAGGDNAQSGAPAGSETEHAAPGISTDKKADDTK